MWNIDVFPFKDSNYGIVTNKSVLDVKIIEIGYCDIVIWLKWSVE